jgi:predicted dehydrogenase
MKKKINIGIIGKNFGQKVILNAFTKNKHLNVIAISSLKKPENKILKEDKIIFYSNWKKMIDNKLINAVAIATPPHIQEKIINYSIKKKKHIFCEKPFTESFFKANRLLNILKKNNKVANIVNYIFPEIDCWKLLKKKIKRQTVKEIKLGWKMNSKFKKNSWKFKHNQGGAVLYNFACHSIYYLEYLFGKITFLKSQVLYKNKNFPYRLKGIFYFFSGAKAEVDINLFSRKKQFHQVKVKTNKSSFNLSSGANSIYDKFNLKLERPQKKIFKFNKQNNYEKKDFRIEPTYKNSIKFSKWILNKKEYEPNFKSALRIHYILKCIIKSSKLEQNIFLTDKY